MGRSKSSGKDANGKRRRTAYGRTKAEARAKLRAIQSDASAGIFESATVTVAEFLTAWLASIRSQVEPKTYGPYARNVRLHIVPHLGPMKLAKVDAFAIRQFYAALEAGKMSPAQRRRVGTALWTALKAAVTDGLIRSNPAVGVPKPRVSKPELKVLDPDHVGRFLEATRTDRLHALYVLAIDSGMRQGELFGLRWDDLDFACGSLQVRRSLEEIDGAHRIKEVKTAGSKRRIDLSPFALDEQRKAMLAEGRDVKEGTVFVDTDGGFLRKQNMGRRSFKPALLRAGAPDVRFHDLRHTFATLLLMAEANVKVVSERLGHSNVTITLNTHSQVLPTM